MPVMKSGEMDRGRWGREREVERERGRERDDRRGEKERQSFFVATIAGLQTFGLKKKHLPSLKSKQDFRDQNSNVQLIFFCITAQLKHREGSA